MLQTPSKQFAALTNPPSAIAISAMGKPLRGERKRKRGGRQERKTEGKAKVGYSWSLRL